MNITSNEIVQLAPNAAAAKNGRDLFLKQKFAQLSQSSDGSVIWGECAGSGKNPYYCSADYIEPSNPVFRCNCPSRQFPCKHAIGLLYAFEQGSTFMEAEIPEDIQSKRLKIEKKEEKKAQVKELIKEKADKPKKINKVGALKKIETQLNGIQLAKKLLRNLVQMGLSSLDAKEIMAIKLQVKELGNYYIPGVQGTFEHLLVKLSQVKNEQYTPVIDHLNYCDSLLKKADVYLNERKENPTLEPELTSSIEEQIGTIWKLSDLMQYGLYEENASLMQLSFNSYIDEGRKEYVDEGYWFNLNTAQIVKTQNYRPFKAAKYIKEDNTVFEVQTIKELFLYPGNLNPRARWETGSSRNMEKSDLEKVHQAASTNYAELIKTAKNSIKNPLMNKYPVAIIALHRVFLNGDYLVAEDQAGNKLSLRDIPSKNSPTEHSLKAILPSNVEGISLLVMLNNNLESGLFSAQALSLITEKRILRLLY